MAAPMKMTYGTTLKFFGKKVMKYGKVNLLNAVGACHKCISSQTISCHSQIRPQKRCYPCESGKITYWTVKGSNSSIFKQSHPICRVSCVLKDLRNSKTVISTTDCTAKRHHVSASANATRKDELKETTRLRSSLKEVKENVWTVPNMLTMSRIMLTPVIGYLVVEESYSVALGLFTFAGLTDLLDGYIARNFKNQMSAFGTALDPLADKILITVLTVTLTMAQLLPVPLAVLIIGRDVLLIATGFVIRYISLPPPRTIKRYFDITNPTAKLLPSTLSKINTALQLSLVCFTLAAPVFGFIDHPALQCLWGLTAATTFGSGVGYVITRKKSVQFLQKDSKITNK
ncbi:cardiolipin synthase (CMP-forming)-like [Mercenaria mercenaria]|uniref:cardiolipin synthase (CMP-forming)-like n=1 Tax=Mercenaria mercenaria TaxID=6596 RepID=UPI001E1E1CFE|nr:cardiolipin synthase (CMP-forming)-like [Mercenaria mercenaria]